MIKIGYGMAPHLLLNYIRRNAVNGTLQRSMADIAKDIGVTNATVHRSLRKLEKEGLIEVVPSDNPRLPCTIVYKGEEESTANDIAKETIEKLDTLLNTCRMIVKQSRELELAFNQMLVAVKGQEEDLRRYNVFKGSVISINELPGGLMQIIARTTPETVELFSRIKSR